mmetsp:Transcript_19578/g.52808  ORF Transcript_19578/g.52808 Transcript_19578/m.52808 type:complete len:246 (+) Transcript_19578:192-929(+)
MGRMEPPPPRTSFLGQRALRVAWRGACRAARTGALFPLGFFACTRRPPGATSTALCTPRTARTPSDATARAHRLPRKGKRSGGPSHSTRPSATTRAPQGASTLASATASPARLEKREGLPTLERTVRLCTPTQAPTRRRSTARMPTSHVPHRRCRPFAKLEMRAYSERGRAAILPSPGAHHTITLACRARMGTRAGGLDGDACNLHPCKASNLVTAHRYYVVRRSTCEAANFVRQTVSYSSVTYA